MTKEWFLNPPFPPPPPPNSLASQHSNNYKYDNYRFLLKTSEKSYCRISFFVKYVKVWKEINKEDSEHYNYSQLVQQEEGEIF